MRFTEKKRIAILGSTGSIGKQALETLRCSLDLYEVSALTAHSNVELIITQAREFLPKYVALGDKSKYARLKEGLSDLPMTIACGKEAVAAAVELAECDLALIALVGFAGLEPTIRAIKAGKTIALANKETLVVAGEYIMTLANKNNVQILPIDSEHSAIWQCLLGENKQEVHKIYLTASGGPFRGFTKVRLGEVTLQDALKHPNWSMGHKITIDSATMMNKGLEVIEARWLFDFAPSSIDVIVHPQSVAHSFVEFIDGSLKAQLGTPDMRTPISLALSYPKRTKLPFKKFNFLENPCLTFESIDKNVFRTLDFAYKALEQNGNMPCILNAANEIAVNAFLSDKINFLQIMDCVENAMAKCYFLPEPTLQDLITTDEETRNFTLNCINTF